MYKDTDICEITHILPLSDHRVLVRFGDGCVKISDLTPLLTLGPAFKPVYENDDVFFEMKHDRWSIYWFDHDLDYSADSLYVRGEDVEI